MKGSLICAYSSNELFYAKLELLFLIDHCVRELLHDTVTCIVYEEERLLLLVLPSRDSSGIHKSKLLAQLSKCCILHLLNVCIHKAKLFKSTLNILCVVDDRFKISETRASLSSTNDVIFMIKYNQGLFVVWYKGNRISLYHA